MPLWLAPVPVSGQQIVISRQGSGRFHRAQAATPDLTKCLRRASGDSATEPLERRVLDSLATWTDWRPLLYARDADPRSKNRMSTRNYAACVRLKAPSGDAGCRIEPLAASLAHCPWVAATPDDVHRIQASLRHWSYDSTGHIQNTY